MSLQSISDMVSRARRNGDTRKYADSPTDFKKQLRWLINNPPEESVPMYITPSMAAEMLAYNDKNRPLSSGTVEQYAAEMKAGRWVSTRVPILFSQRLLDGQHRLSAVVESGVTITADVTFGVDDQAFAFIDRGKKRTAGDVFAIHGVVNANAIAATCRIVAAYDDGSISGNARARHGNPDQLYALYERNRGIDDSMWVFSRIAAKRLCSPSVMAALHYVCARKCRSDADKFFDKVTTGLGYTGKGDPAYKLREHLEKASRERGHLVAGEVAKVVLTAWNNERLGRRGRALRIDYNKPVPRAR